MPETHTSHRLTLAALTLSTSLLVFCAPSSSTRAIAQEPPPRTSTATQNAPTTSTPEARLRELEHRRGLAQSSTPREGRAPESYGKLLLKMVLGMLAIIALAYVSIRFGLKRLLPEGASQGKLRVLLRQPIEPRRSLLVVQVASRHMLLASSEQGITFLTELSDEDASQLVDREVKSQKQDIPREFSVELDDPVS